MTDTSFNPEKLENDEIEINDWKNQPESNVLQKGRYPFKVLEIINTNHIAPSGNVCFVIDILIDSWKKQRCWLVKHDGNGNKTKGSYLYTNFLYSIGIRNQNKKFKVKLSQIVGGKGLCDVNLKPDGTDNTVQNFASEKEPNAPMTDVPLENEVDETKKPTEEKDLKEKPKEKAKENDDESVDNL